MNNINLQLTEGRFFSYSDPIQKFFIANQSFMKQMNWKNIDNKKWQNKKLIGVIKDFHFRSLYEKVAPMVIELGDGGPIWTYNVLNIRIESKNPKKTITEINNIWHKVLPYYAFSYGSYSDWVLNQYKNENEISVLIILFAGLAIVISCLGILGLTSFIIKKRTKEIGIHKVNGAKIWQVVFLLNKEIMVWVMIAFIIACPIAWYAMHKWLQNFAYKTALSWWIFALAGLIALIIALLTVSWQTWRAATRNPVEALRYE